MTQESLSYRDAGVDIDAGDQLVERIKPFARTVSYTHLRAHETVLELVCRLLLEKKNTRPVQT